MPLAELPADKAAELVHVKVVAPTMLTRAVVAGSDLGDFFPATLELALYGLGLALILAGLLACRSAAKARSSTWLA